MFPHFATLAATDIPLLTLQNEWSNETKWKSGSGVRGVQTGWGTMCETTLLVSTLTCMQICFAPPQGTARSPGLCSLQIHKWKLSHDSLISMSERTVLFKDLTSLPLFSVTIFLSLKFEKGKLHVIRDFIDIRTICSLYKEYNHLLSST